MPAIGPAFDEIRKYANCSVARANASLLLVADAQPTIFAYGSQVRVSQSKQLIEPLVGGHDPALVVPILAVDMDINHERNLPRAVDLELAGVERHVDRVLVLLVEAAAVERGDHDRLDPSEALRVHEL